MERLPPRIRLPLAALGLAALAVLAVAFADVPLARLIHAHGQPLAPMWLAITEGFDAASGIDVARYFAGTVLIVAGLVAAATPRLRSYAGPLWIVAATHLAARLTTGPWKELFGRLRPYQWFEAAQPAHTFFTPPGIAFPSGHVIYYLSLCLPLAIRFPRFRTLYLAIPVVLAITRIGAEQHWIGDTIAAAAWVTFVTWVVGVVFERRLRRV